MPRLCFRRATPSAGRGMGKGTQAAMGELPLQDTRPETFLLRRHVGSIIAVLVLLGLLGGAVWSMVAVWTRINATMSGHGWVALVLGVVTTLAVGVGLMGLM